MDVMAKSKLLEKAYNCYMYFVTNVLYGRTNQDYDMLYGATLMLKNNITNQSLTECFENRLNCPTLYSLAGIDSAAKLITWTLNTALNVNDTFVWNEIPYSQEGVYTFNTTSTPGFNFLYISIPQDTDMFIHNSMDIILLDTGRPSSDDDQLFHLVGTYTTSTGSINNVFRKNDVYNSNNPVFFKLKIY